VSEALRGSGLAGQAVFWTTSGLAANRFQRRTGNTDGFLQYDFRFMHIVALHEVYAELKKYGHGIGVFYALGNREDISLNCGGGKLV